MRAVLAILAASLVSIANDGVTFKCGKDPHGKSMCACIGAAACSEMQKSDSCISGIECHSSQLGTIICSCKAVEPQRKNPRGDVSEPPSPRRRPAFFCGHDADTSPREGHNYLSLFCELVPLGGFEPPTS